MFNRLYKHITGFGWDRYLKDINCYYVPLYMELHELKNEYYGITLDIVNDIKNNNSTFVFDYTGEGCDGVEYVELLLETLSELGLNKKDLSSSTLLTSNMGSTFSRVWPGLHIGVDMYMWGKGWRSSEYTPIVDKKPYRFICLNNSDKKHKNFIINHLDENYDEQGIITYLSKGRTSFVDDGNLDDMDKLQSKFYDNVYFSVRNTALFYEEDSIFICEKLLQDINGQVPFIAISTPGTLQHLRNCGYETFPELFDETYDTILNHDERMNFILKEIDRVMKMSDEELHSKIVSMKDKLKRNYEKLMSDISSTNYNKIFSEITKRIVEHAN